MIDMQSRPPRKKVPATAQKGVKVASKKQSTKTSRQAVQVEKHQPPARPRGWNRFNVRLWQIRRSEYQARRKPLPSVWYVAQRTAITLWRSKRVLIGIVVVYGLLNLILVQGFANATDISSWHTALDKTIHGQSGGIGSGITAFTLLIGTASSGSTSSSAAYQIMLLLITSLVIIWSLRQTYMGAKITIRQAFYNGVYPLIPFLLIILLIGVELLPATIGAALYSLVTANGIAATLFERTIWAIVFAALGISSLYLLSSSVFALYIVTLPDMTPFKALRSARELVRYRRITLLVKILFLPVALLVIIALILAPIVLLITSLTQWVFFLLAMLALAAVHTYMYTLYREIIND